MAKKKMSMYRTFKTSVFNPVIVNGKNVPVVSIFNNRLFINDDCCDLRTIGERYNPVTKELAPSVVDCINQICAVTVKFYVAVFFNRA